MKNIFQCGITITAVNIVGESELQVKTTSSEIGCL